MQYVIKYLKRVLENNSQSKLTVPELVKILNDGLVDLTTNTAYLNQSQLNAIQMLSRWSKLFKQHDTLCS